MIIYNVTVKLEKEIEAAWVSWIKDQHIADLMNTGLFTDARLCRLLEQDETDGVTYIAQYFCKSIDEYNKYIDEHAPRMREEGFKKFGNRFIAFRTVMEVVS